MLDKFDTPGGAIAILLFLSLVGVALSAAGLQHGDYIVSTAMGALMAILRGFSPPPPSNPAPAGLTEGKAA